MPDERTPGLNFPHVQFEIRVYRPDHGEPGDQGRLYGINSVHDLDFLQPEQRHLLLLEVETMVDDLNTSMSDPV